MGRKRIRRNWVLAESSGGLKRVQKKANRSPKDIMGPDLPLIYNGLTHRHKKTLVIQEQLGVIERT